MTYSFELVLDVPKLTLKLADLLYEKCGDATLGQSQGIVSLIFDREANSIEEAVESAVENVRKLGIGIVKIKLLP